MISVIIPAYNAERFISECIDSLISQTSPDWEAIVVDDGSTDNTKVVCSKYCIRDSRIKYIYKKNSGVTETRWHGVKEAKGDFITFLDADDILFPNAIETICKNLSNGIDIINFRSLSFRNKNNIFTGKGQSTPAIFQGRKSLMSYILTGKILSTVWGSVYRRSLIIDLQIEFCNGLKIAEDTLFNLMLAYRKSPKVLLLDNILYGYRQNPDSVTHTFDSNRYQSIKDSILFLNSFLEKEKIADDLKGEAGFRYLLLWSTYFFHPDNMYYLDQELRKIMRKHFFSAFPYLYGYLRVYLFCDLFISSRLAQRMFNKSCIENK